MATDNNQQRSKEEKGDKKVNKGRGFAAMDPEQQRLIASQGGRAAHASGNAHQFSSEEARAAGSRSRGNAGGGKNKSAAAARGTASDEGTAVLHGGNADADDRSTLIKGGEAPDASESDSASQSSQQGRGKGTSAGRKRVSEAGRQN